MGNDWFDLDITVTVAGEDVPLVRLFTEIATGATHMLLPSGTYFALDTPELRRLRELIEEAQALGELESGRVNAGSHNVTLWEELLSLGVVDAQVRAWQTSVQRMSAARPPEAITPPTGLRAELREYQRDGLNWLWFLVGQRVRRDSRRRHGARQDAAGACAVLPGARAGRGGAVPGGRPDECRHQLGGRVRPVRAGSGGGPGVLDGRARARCRSPRSPPAPTS